MLWSIVVAISDLAYFVNNEDALQRISETLREHRSCAIIGGTCMGKTSILKYIQTLITQSTYNDRYGFKDIEHLVIPIYFEFNPNIELNLLSLYKHLISIMQEQIRELLKNSSAVTNRRVIENLSFQPVLAKQKALHHPDDIRDSFISDLRSVRNALLLLDPNKDIKLLLLVDNLYRWGTYELQQEVFRHLLHLLHSSYGTEFPFGTLNCILTCSESPINFFVGTHQEMAMSNPFESIFLTVFGQSSIADMVDSELKLNPHERPNWHKEVVEEVFSISGGHPYLAQRSIRRICVMINKIHHNTLSLTQIFEQNERQLRDDLKIIYRWVDEQIKKGTLIQEVFEALCQNSQSLSSSEILNLISSSNKGLTKFQIEEVLDSLKTFGAIAYNSATNKYKISGKYCCELLTSVSKEQMEKTMPAQQTLNRNDLYRLRTIIDSHPIWRYKSPVQRKAILDMAGLPSEITNNLPLDGTNTDTIMLLNQLMNFGQVQNRPNYTALGTWIDHILNESSEIEGTLFLANLIFYYNLIKDQNYLRQVEAKYGLFSTFPTTNRTSLGWTSTGIPQTQWQDERNAAVLEKVWRERAAFLDVVFLEKGLQAARSVCCIEKTDGSAIGTGFLIAPNLVLTNHHVLPNDAILTNSQVRLGFRLDISGQLQRGSTHRIKRQIQFSPVDNLDYILIELEDSPGNYPEVGYLKPSVKVAKVDAPLYIIQHPEGKPQKVVLQENWITYLALDHRRIQYLTNTEYGSSGAPAFDDNWDLVAIHHSRAPVPQINPDMNIEGNEGIPLIAILPEIRNHLPYSVD